jgi:hypothetical protein
MLGLGLKLRLGFKNSGLKIRVRDKIRVKG